ncbi:TraM recognition domain-containing protein, partial [Corynebacterium bovis]
SAAKLYGGNVSDEAYLRDLSAAVGHHSVAYGSRSTSSSGVSHSTNVHREPILESDDLEALPKQLALLQTPGNRPVLVRKDFIFNNRELNRRMRDDTTSGEEAK